MESLLFKQDNNINKQNNVKDTTYKSRNCPPQMPLLKDFETDLLKIIQNIQFRITSSEFLSTLKQDADRIKKLKKLFVSADKTQNFYEVDRDTYKKILMNNITNTYQKADISLPTKINKDAKRISKKFSIEQKIDIMPQQQSFITIKDHKENFRTNPKYRLLNPTKSELGKLSKNI